MKNLKVVGSSSTVWNQVKHWVAQPALEFSRQAVGGAIQLDLDDPGTWSNLRPSQEDTILILAAVSSPSECHHNIQMARKINLNGTLALVEEALGAGSQVIFASTDLVYSGGHAMRFGESHPLEPTTLYGEWKAEVEAAFSNNPKFSALRFSNVVSRESVFLRWSELETTAKFFTNLIRTPVHPADLADLITCIISEQTPIPNAVNISGPEDLSRYEIAKRVLGDQTDVIPELRDEVNEVGIPLEIRTKSELFERLLGKNLRAVVPDRVLP